MNEIDILKNDVYILKQTVALMACWLENELGRESVDALLTELNRLKTSFKLEAQGDSDE